MMAVNLRYLDLAISSRAAHVNSISTEALDLPCNPCFYKFPCKGNINYMGSAFQPNTSIATDDIQSLLDKRIIETHRISLHCISAAEAVRQFDFKTHGFCVEYLPVDLKGSLDRLEKDLKDPASRAATRPVLSSYLTAWGKNQGISFTHVIPVDTVCRSTSEEAENAFRAVTLVHIDFSLDTNKTLEAFCSTWKPRVEQAFKRPLSDEEYIKLPVTQIVNVWMPLNTFPHVNSLALLDKQTASDQDAQPYTAVRRDSSTFTAQILPRRPEHRWSVFDIKRGEAIIFGSQQTPHTAIEAVADFNREGCPDNGGRKSVEIRALFVNKN